ncbi:MAG TPA: cyclic peptide export ABC transporter [Pyrinomonadaceae bacterium]|nr:cyclic peptide export ABC transporter [Pyrinomonadaceae bacterium]
MVLLISLLKRFWRVVVLATLAGLAAGATSAALIAMTNDAISGNEVSIRWQIVIFTILGLMMLLANFASRTLLIQISQRAVMQLRLQLSERILATPLRLLEQVGSPRLLVALSDDTFAISSALTIVPSLCSNLATMAVCLVYLGWLSMPVLFGLLGLMLIGIISYQRVAAIAQRYLRRARLEQDNLFRHYRSLTEGTKELKLHRDRREEFLREILTETAESCRHLNTAGMTIYAGADSWGHFLFFVLIGLALFGLPAAGYADPRTLIGYTLIILYMKTPVEIILALLPMVARARIALRQLERLGLRLTSLPAEIAQNGRPQICDTPTLLEFDGITHNYRREGEDGSFKLGPIDLSFCAGEVVFLVGGNGSGKTTLAKLISGLYVPESGTIRLNGLTITDELRDYYRQHFTAVFSDFFLFESFIGLAGPNLDSQARQYLKDLELAHKVSVKEGKLSTTELSHGQRKRLALLTAYLEDRPFYIFDEWASDQDPIFKQVFYKQIVPALKERGKAVLVVTHDDKYFHCADRLLKLDFGKLDHSEFEREPMPVFMASA